MGICIFVPQKQKKPLATNGTSKANSKELTDHFSLSLSKAKLVCWQQLDHTPCSLKKTHLKINQNLANDQHKEGIFHFGVTRFCVITFKRKITRHPKLGVENIEVENFNWKPVRNLFYRIRP